MRITRASDKSCSIKMDADSLGFLLDASALSTFQIHDDEADNTLTQMADLIVEVVQLYLDRGKLAKVFENETRRHTLALVLERLHSVDYVRVEKSGYTDLLVLSKRLIENKPGKSKRWPKGQVGECHYCGQTKPVKRSTRTNKLTCPKCYHENEAPKIECCKCHIEKPVQKWTDDGPVCKQCDIYHGRTTVGKCSICKQEKPVPYTNNDAPACSSCYDKYVRPRPICSICGKPEIVKKIEDGKVIGKNCYQYKRRHGYYPNSA